MLSGEYHTLDAVFKTKNIFYRQLTLITLNKARLETLISTSSSDHIYTQNMSSSEDEISKKCWFSYINGHDLVTDNTTGSSQKKLLVRGFCREHPSFIPVAISGLCFRWYYIAEDSLDAARVNIIDMDFKSILQRKLVYKDTMYRELLIGWSAQTGIPMEHLMVYNFTERKNKTARPNRQIVVDMDEEFKGDAKWSDDQVRSIYKIRGIYDRIGNVMVKKRSFLLLDRRRIPTLVSSLLEDYNRTYLVALKYFDFLEQKLYLVDWLRIRSTSITFSDITEYIESNVIPNNKSSGGRLYSLYKLNGKLNEFEEKSQYEKVPKFCVYDEEAALSNKDNQSDPLVKINKLKCDDPVDYFYNGDIFVFQLNPFHPYFSMIDIRYQDQYSPLHFSMEFEQKGMFWHQNADKFIESQANMIDIEINIRDSTEWQQFWSKALIRQYQSTNGNVGEIENDGELYERITRSSHKWTLDKRTTFGMIRKRLGSYYNIEPEHFEIWLSKKWRPDTWNYGSTGHRKWHHTLPILIGGLQFEIQMYNVKDFEEMIAYHNSSVSIYRLSPEFVDVGAHGLALFNLQFYLPSYPTMLATTTKMTMIYSKDWTAKEFIQHILNQIIENPLFLFAHLSHITEYIRRFEMVYDAGYSGTNFVGEIDIEIARDLSPNRFLILDMEKKTPVEYHMDDEYKMPDSYSQIKYTEFRVQFLAKNDPLVIQSEIKAESERKENERTEMELDHGKLNANQEKTNALWVHIIRFENGKRISSKIRVVIEDGESFKDLILRDIWPYLKVNEFSPLLPDDFVQRKIKGQTSGIAPTDLLESIIESKVKFSMVGCGSENRCFMVEGDMLGRKVMESTRTADMWLEVLLPEGTAEDSMSIRTRRDWNGNVI